MNFKQWIESYQGYHKAPDRENGSPLHDLSNIYPEDIYSSNGARYYGHGENIDFFTVAVIQSARGKPEMQIKVYRAVPKVITNSEQIKDLLKQKAYILKTGKIPSRANTHLKRDEYYDFISQQIEDLGKKQTIEDKVKINPGDWVTINRDYAVLHGKSTLLGSYRVLSKTVKAKELFTDGNSIHEWGYYPN